MAARRQMRTPGERTSGAWTGGCVIHPDGGDETDRTAGNSYTATPHNTQGASSGQVTALIMAGASVVAYIIGEGLTDSANIGSDDSEE